MVFAEPSESMFASVVQTTFDDLRTQGFVSVAPIVYGCSYADSNRAVTITYDQRRHSVRPVVQRHMTATEQPARPDVNIVSDLASTEQSNHRRLATLLLAHLAAVYSSL